MAQPPRPPEHEEPLGAPPSPEHPEESRAAPVVRGIALAVFVLALLVAYPMCVRLLGR